MLLGLILLYAATRKVESAMLVAALKDANWPSIVGVLTVTAAFVALKAWRWKILLNFAPAARFRDLHSAVYVGLAVNFMLSHAGEFLRATVVAHKVKVAFSAILASVLVERTMDFVALLALFSAFAFSASDLPGVVSLAGSITVGVVVIGVMSIYLLLHPPSWLATIVATLVRPLPDRVVAWLENQLALSREGFESIKDLRLMLGTFAISVVQWLLVIGAIRLSAEAVGETVSLVAIAIIFVVIVIGLTLPNAPLQIGTTQFAFSLGMGADGASASSAIAASIVYTAFLIIPILIIGGSIAIRGRSMAAASMR